MSPLQQYFADELRRAREAKGMTQEQLAAKLFVSKSLVAMIETCQRPPRRDFAAAVDGVLGTNGRFDRMRAQLLQAEATPEWFRPWVDFEREAVEIVSFQPLLIPGLLQTEDYARALLEGGRPDQAENLLSARMERQQVLDRASVSVVVDEAVLRRRVGRPDVMHRQLKHLAECPAVVQVLPREPETYQHLQGGFTLALVDDVKIGYVDTAGRGYVADNADVVSTIQRRWDIIRGEALPRRQSRDLILETAESWTSSS